MDQSICISSPKSILRPDNNNPSSNSEGNADIRSDQSIIATWRRHTGTNLNQNGTSENQETSNDTETEDKILSVYWRAGKLGAAYYVIQTEELYLLEEIVDRPPAHAMFCNLFRRADPVRVILDGKMGSTFVATVKKTVFDNDDDTTRCKLTFVSAKEYSFEACKRRVYSVSLPNEPKHCTDDERMVFLKTLINFNQTQSLHALGALLKYLDLNWTSLNLDLYSKPRFLSLKKLSLADIVTIDEDTYRGLQIFSSVSHPSNFKKGIQSSNKEGMSLFHIFNKCSSKAGQNMMRILLQHPTNDIDTLKRRQDVVAFFMKSQNETLMKNICSSLRFVKNVNGILAKITALSTKAYQWKSLYNTLYNVVLICEMCENVNGAGDFVTDLGYCDNTKLYEMALYMNRVIDFEGTKNEGKFTVKPGVDSELDKKKQTMASLHGLMSETAKIEFERLPEFIEECTMLYMPHLGYLLGVKAWADHLTPEQKELPDMRFMFQNNDYIHYKSKGCEELDIMIGDTYPEIVAHETKIKMRLTSIILENLQSLSSVIEKCAELDCLISISKVCKEYNFVRPVLTTDKIIKIIQGKHPLLMTNNENFVPNDFESTDTNGFVKILTGPNASGKSVYMKQIGLIVYLAHIGSFVPADSATIGTLSHIFTRIESTECVAAHMSAFLIDLRQMSLVLHESSPNSLILIDEFGKGTSEVDGTALLASSINSLLCREDACPHIVLATHMLTLPKFIMNSDIVRYQRFEYMMVEGEVVFLFRLTDGSVETSFAHRVAESRGIDKHIVSRAGLIQHCIENNTLPQPNKKIVSKLRTFTETIKNKLLADE